MAKIRCILVDDEPVGLKLLKTYCEQLENYCEVEGAFHSAESFLQKHDKLKYDVIMLDIDMDGMKGTDLARILDDKHVIFVTGRDGYDKEVLDLQFTQENIVTLIRKPLDREKIERAFKKFLAGKTKRNSVVLDTSSGERNLNFDDIYLITTKEDGFKQGVLSKSIINGKFDARNKILVTKPEIMLLNHIDFPELISILPSDLFFRINRSTIVSRKAIQSYDTQGITFVPELKAFISSAYFNVSSDFQREFKAWYRR